jgi:hypothetical protein
VVGIDSGHFERAASSRPASSCMLCDQGRLGHTRKGEPAVLLGLNKESVSKIAANGSPTTDQATD